MSQINSTAASPAATNTLVGNSVEDLDLDVFLDLMLAELQNQDPLNPMENEEMLNTISQIREISANDKLSETLESVLLGQNVATAAGLIGTDVEALTDDGQRVVGAVNEVAINDGEPRLEITTSTSVSATETEGEVPEGQYIYTVIWETDEGPVGAQVQADTTEYGDDFNGSLRVENIPDLVDGPKAIYRTDSDGQVRRLATLPESVRTFTDVFSNSRGDAVESLPADTVFFRPDGQVSVKLSSVSNVKTR
ncbi:MAG: flagellar hook capping FlgD N-terminal domain-containing protein [Planctomycetota bacterium]